MVIFLLSLLLNFILIRYDWRPYCMISICFYLLKFVLWYMIWAISVEVPCVYGKKVCTAVGGLLESISWWCSLVLLYSCPFSVLVLSIMEKGMLKSMWTFLLILSVLSVLDLCILKLYCYIQMYIYVLYIYIFGVVLSSHVMFPFISGNFSCSEVYIV